jgi:hypothetical protein
VVDDSDDCSAIELRFWLSAVNWVNSDAFPKRLFSEAENLSTKRASIQ